MLSILICKRIVFEIISASVYPEIIMMKPVSVFVEAMGNAELFSCGSSMGCLIFSVSKDYYRPTCILHVTVI